MNMTNSCGNLHFMLALCGLAITFATLKTWGEILASFESMIFYFFFLFQPPQGCAAMVPTEFSGIICLIAVNMAIWTYPLPHGITNEYLIFFPPRIIRCYAMWWYHKIFRLSPCSRQNQQWRIAVSSKGQDFTPKHAEGQFFNGGSQGAYLNLSPGSSFGTTVLSLHSCSYVRIAHCPFAALSQLLTAFQHERFLLLATQMWALLFSQLFP